MRKVTKYCLTICFLCAILAYSLIFRSKSANNKENNEHSRKSLIQKTQITHLPEQATYNETLTAPTLKEAITRKLGVSKISNENKQAHKRQGPNYNEEGCWYLALQNKEKNSDIEPAFQDGELIYKNISRGIFVYKMKSKRFDSQQKEHLLTDTLDGQFNELPHTEMKNNTSFLTDQVIAQFNPQTKISEIESFLESHNASIVKERTNHKNQFVIETASIFSAKNLVETMKLSQSVLWAHENPLLKSKSKHIPTDEDYNFQWYLNNTGQAGGASKRDIDAEQAWDITRGTSSVVIAIIDDGFDMVHPDLAGNVYSNISEGIPGVDGDGNGYTNDYRGWDFGQNDNDPSPVYNGKKGNNHGTAVAGLAAATTDNSSNGIASIGYDCRFLPVRIGAYASASTWADAIEYGASLADIISISYFLNTNDVIYAALNYAITQGRNGKGCVVSTAFGNDGVMRRYSRDASSSPEVVSISANSNHDKKSWFGDYGPSLNILCPSGGGSSELWTTDRLPPNGYNSSFIYNFFNGTSGSCPIGSGIMALIIANNPTLTGLEVRRILEESCDKIDAVAYPYTSGYSHNIRYGYGRANAWRALTTTIPEWDTYETDNTFDSATDIYDGQIQYHSLDGSNDVDWATFTLSKTTDIRLSLLGSTNTQVTLYNSLLNKVADQDTGYPSFSRLTQTLSAGTYYAKVESRNSAAAPHYGLHFGILNMADEYESDNSLATAKTIQPREMQYRTFYPAGDLDWATFTITNAGNTAVDIWTMGEIAGDTKLSLLNSAGTLMGDTDDIITYDGTNYLTNSFFSHLSTQLVSGTYYILLTEYSDKKLSSYQLVLETFEPDSYEPNNNTNNAIAIAPGDRINQTIYPSNDTDWFSFTITNYSSVIIMTDSFNPNLSTDLSDTELILYQDTGSLSMVASNDNGNNLTFSAICIEDLEPAAYYIKVQGHSPTNLLCPNYYLALDIYEQDNVIDTIKRSSSNMTLIWPGNASHQYEIQYTHDIENTSSWNTAIILDGLPGTNLWIDDGAWASPAPLLATNRYYRIITD